MNQHRYCSVESLFHSYQFLGFAPRNPPRSCPAWCYCLSADCVLCCCCVFQWSVSYPLCSHCRPASPGWDGSSGRTKETQLNSGGEFVNINRRKMATTKMVCSVYMQPTHTKLKVICSVRIMMELQPTLMENKGRSLYIIHLWTALIRNHTDTCVYLWHIYAQSQNSCRL